MYKLHKDRFNEILGVIRTSDNAFIPMSDDNTDYQAYLKWLEEGGVPTPADK